MIEVKSEDGSSVGIPTGFKKYALLIGLNYPGTDSELRGCIDDVKSMLAELEERGYLRENCVILTDDKKFTPEPTRYPTKKNIIAALRVVTSRVKAGDSLFIHYSGHGSYKRDEEGDEADEHDEVICTADDDVITDDELNKFIVCSVPDTAKVYIVFDCCHSGSGLDLEWCVRTDARGKPMKEDLLAIDDSGFIRENLKPAEGSDRKNIIMISGCRDTQTSADAKIGGRFRGALTWGLLETLKSAKEKSEKMTWSRVHTNVRKLLRKGGYEQIPQMSMTSKKLYTSEFGF